MARRIRVRGIPRPEPDVRLYVLALIELARQLQVASGIRCKSTGAVPVWWVRLRGRCDSFGLIVGLGRRGGAWPQLAGWFEQRAAQVLEQPQPVAGHGEAAPAGRGPVQDRPHQGEAAGLA